MSGKIIAISSTRNFCNMKKILLLAFFLAPSLTFSQKINSDSVWIVNHYTKIERQIPMRDGVKLFTAIYLPNDKSEKHPILFMRTPYSCAPYGENKFTDRWWTRGDSIYFREGYIMVMQDVRGKFMSEGVFEDVRPFIPDKKSKKETDESTDTYDTIDWLVKNVKNNNGKVGVFGISYPGFYATMAAASNHTALKAVSPQAPVTDWFIGDDFHHKGVPFILDGFNFFRTFGVPRRELIQTWPKVPPITGSDNYQFFLNQGTYAELKQKYMGDSIKFWNDVQAHPNYDDWWKARNARNAAYNIKPAILIVGGLFDAENCWGAWNLYKAMEKQSPSTNCKLVEGPWFHGGWARSSGEKLGNVWFERKNSIWYARNIELPFFNYYLKGKGNIDQIKEANIFITGENQWHQFDEWPPKNSEPTNLYLHQNAKLAFNKPYVTVSFDSYVSDPMNPVPYMEDVHWSRPREYMTDDQRFASRRPDVLTYQTEVLQEDVTITGPVIADLFVIISGTDADFVVKVIDVFPDDFEYPDSLKMTYPMGGYQMLVRGEIMRGRFRNSFEKPEPFVPGEITEVKFELPDVAHTFKKGHRIMVQIQSTWYPLADRNPQEFIDPYQCTTKDLVPCMIQIYHDGKYPSRIEVPVLK